MNTQEANGYQKSPQSTPQKRLVVTLPDNFDKAILKSLSSLFDRCELGSMKVYLSIGNSKLETPYCIKNTTELEGAIKKISPEGKIEVW
jgi:hypothetical protein